MYREGLIKGERKDFPLTLEVASGMYYEYVEVDDSNDLVELFYDFMKDDFNKKKPLKKVLQELGIKDTVMFFDHRTERILNEYVYHRDAPSKAFDNYVWYESVITLNGILWQAMI